MDALEQERTPLRARRIVWIVGAAVCVCVLIGTLLFVRARSVTVVCGEESERVIALSRDPFAIVERSSFQLGVFDSLKLDNLDNGTIEIQRGALYNAFGGTTTLVQSDVVSAAIAMVDQRMESEKNNRPFKVTVVADKKKHKVAVTGGTVEEAVQTAGVTLGEDDILNYQRKTLLRKGMVIRVKRIEYRDVVRTKPIAFETTEQKTDQLYIGERRQKRPGKEGERASYSLAVVVNGMVQDEMKLGTAVKKEPVNEVVLVGTKPHIVQMNSVGGTGFPEKKAISELPATIDILLDVNGKPVNYKRKIVGQATAYSGGGITSTGRSAMPGRVAVDPREIPYGTKMYIVSCDGRYTYGYCEAADTGGFIYNSRTVVDLYMHSEQACVQFGRRNVEIYIF